MEKHYTIKEVAEQIRKTEDTARAYCKQGLIRAVKQPDGNWLVSESALQEFITGSPADTIEKSGKVSGDEPEVIEARKQTVLEEEQKKQAIYQNEKHKAEIEIRLRQNNYDSLEAGLLDIAAKQKEALDLLETANKERSSVRVELEALAKERQKLDNAIAVVKLREEMVDKKRAEIMIIEEKQKAFVGKYNGWKKSLEELIDYHKSHILPCAEALGVVRKTIYRWAGLLSNNTGYDFTELSNYIGEKMTTIDQYIDHTIEVGSKGTEEATESEEVDNREQV